MPTDLETLLALSPVESPFDCLLEASQGDRASFEMRERMAIRDYGTLLSYRVEDDLADHLGRFSSE